MDISDYKRGLFPVSLILMAVTPAPSSAALASSAAAQRGMTTRYREPSRAPARLSAMKMPRAVARRSVGKDSTVRT